MRFLADIAIQKIVVVKDNANAVLMLFPGPINILSINIKILLKIDRSCFLHVLDV